MVARQSIASRGLGLSDSSDWLCREKSSGRTNGSARHFQTQEKSFPQIASVPPPVFRVDVGREGEPAAFPGAPLVSFHKREKKKKTRA